ncbi:MAG: hypothetical protein IJZ22_05620 [Bacteroidaceae bacterium]|nr:hypothetical protein [Bacteroidaceae bacterium]
MRKFTLFFASLFIAIGAMAQIEFTFTRGTWPNADVTVSGADGVTATIAATAASNAWNTGGALASATNILCANTNTSAASTTPITFTLTISGLGAANIYDNVTFTHKAMNSGGNYQPAGSDTRHCNFTLTANGTEFSTKTDENIWVANGSENYSKDIEFTSTNADFTQITANEDGTLTLVLTIYKGTTNAGCFYGLTKITLANSDDSSTEEAATTISDPENFENGKIYTFVTERGWMGATETSSNVISTAKTSVESTDTDYFKWTVYKSENNNYYLYNIGKAMFMGVQSTNNASIPFAETPQGRDLNFKISSNTSYPIMFSTDNAGVVNHSTSYGEGLITWTGGWTKLDDAGSNHQVTLISDLDETTLNKIADLVATYETDNTEAVEALQAAIDAANAMNEYIGTGLGKYTYTGEGTFAVAVAEYQTYVDAIESTSTPTPAEVEAKTTELNSLVASSLTINVPTAGSYIRIKSYATSQYLASENYGIVNGTNRAAFVADADASTIFYFDGNQLVSYASGNYLVNNSNFLGYNGVQESGATIEFQAANASLNLKGVYSIKLFGNNRWLYAQGGGYTDAGGGNNGANYSFNLEEVTTLPVTITSAGYATLYAPVALEIPEGVTTSTATIDGSYAILNEISDVIPAEVGVVLAGEANTYNFTITTTTTTAESDLKGSAATTYNTEAGTYYALAIANNIVGFYKDSFNNSRFQNNSHKAYLYVPTENNSIACYSFGFDWGGTTGIENVEGAVEENATETIYDITGRQIKAITVPGIYIINGKKTFVK